MDDGSLVPNHGENRDHDRPVTISQMSRDEQTQYLTRLALENPAAFRQLVLQQQGAGVAAMNVFQGGGPSNTVPMGNFAGAFPQAADVPYLQPLPQPTGSPGIGPNIVFGANLAAEPNRLKYTGAISGSQDYDAVVANRLRQADRDGKSYKDALREMHGVRRVITAAYTQPSHTIRRCLAFPRTSGLNTI